MKKDKTNPESVINLIIWWGSPNNNYVGSELYYSTSKTLWNIASRFSLDIDLSIYLKNRLLQHYLNLEVEFYWTCSVETNRRILEIILTKLHLSKKQLFSILDKLYEIIYGYYQDEVKQIKNEIRNYVISNQNLSLTALDQWEKEYDEKDLLRRHDLEERARLARNIFSQHRCGGSSSEHSHIGRH